MSINYVNPSTGSLTPIAGTPASTLTGLQEQINKNGAKNLVDISKTINSNSQTTITNLTDKGFTVSNTTAYQYPASKTLLNLIEDTKYIVDFDVTAISADNTTARSTIRESTNNSIKYSITCTSTGHYTFEFTYQAGYYLSFFPYMGETTAGTGSLTVDNIMLRLASNPDDTYQPYAMTNQELTKYSTITEYTNLKNNINSDLIDTSNSNVYASCYKIGRICHITGSLKFKVTPTELNYNLIIGLPTATSPFYGYLTTGTGESVGMLYNRDNTILRVNTDNSKINTSSIYYFQIIYIAAK